MAEPLDWAGLMRAGLHELHLPPATFWALTPYELALMLGRTGGESAFTRADLATLAARFPDILPPAERTRHE